MVTGASPPIQRPVAPDASAANLAHECAIRASRLSVLDKTAFRAEFRLEGGDLALNPRGARLHW